MVAQLFTVGNNIVVGVSDGSACIGILDDIVTSAFCAPVVDEVVVIPVVGIWVGDGYVSAVDAQQMLRFANIIRSSFVSDVEGLILYEVNGVLFAPAGTRLNYDSNGDGVVDSIRAMVSYMYYIERMSGDNTTIGSGRATFHFARGIYETDQFDTKQRYVVNATLFCNAQGYLTTAQEKPTNPGIAIVTGPPSPLNSTLEFMLF